jgi:SAM-dependent methyltransferase
MSRWATAPSGHPVPTGRSTPSTSVPPGRSPGSLYTCAVDNQGLLRRFYPEANIGGFSHVDGTISFYTQIAAVLKPTDRVLDFGAGRGEPLLDDENSYRRGLSNLQGRCAHVEGCDVDPVVLTNPFLDHAEVIEPGKPLPYPDDNFDIVFARSVFEHIDDSEWLARELLRIVKPGGLIAASTPNKFGYFAVAARMVPNRLHAGALSKVQPGRKAEDVFPTRYRLNSAALLRKAFGERALVYVSYMSSEPGYHFGSPLVYRAVKWLNKHLPNSLQPVILVYIRKY